jgi:hypothetical protein
MAKETKYLVVVDGLGHYDVKKVKVDYESDECIDDQIEEQVWLSNQDAWQLWDKKDLIGLAKLIKEKVK